MARQATAALKNAAAFSTPARTIRMRMLSAARYPSVIAMGEYLGQLSAGQPTGQSPRALIEF
jgi:hypothetical protein